MLEFQQILYFIVSVLGSIFLGMPVAVLIRRGREYRMDIIALAFIMGCALTMLPAYLLSMIGLSMKRIVPILLALDAVLWIAVCVKKLIFLPKAMEWVFLAVCVAAGSLVLIQMVVYHASFPYSDGYTYVSIADYLAENACRTRVELDPYHPWLSQVYLYQNCGFRMGTQFLLSFWAVLFGQEYSIVAYVPISGLAVSLFGSCVWYFLADRKGLELQNRLFAIVFSAFNASIVLWCAIFGFLPQLFGMALVCACLRAVRTAMQENKLSMYIEGAIMAAALCLCYSELAPFYVLMAVMQYVFYSRRQKAWLANMKGLVITAIFSAVLLGPYLVDMLRALIIQFGANVGWNQRTDWLSSISWIISSVPGQYLFSDMKPHKLALLGITLAMAYVLIRGIAKGKKPTSESVILSESIMVSVPFLVMLIYFEFFAANPFGEGAGNAWSIFKLLQYYSIIPFCYYFLYYGSAFSDGGSFNRILRACVPVAFIVLSVVYTTSFSHNITRQMVDYTGSERPMQEYLALSERYEETDRVINLVDIPQQQRKLLTYFLRKNKLASDWTSDGYFSPYSPDMNPDYAPDGIDLVAGTASADSLAGVVELEEDVMPMAS